MRLLLFHPVVASISCKDCCEKMYDFKTGEPLTICNGTLPVVRILPPPCETCPKQSPQREHEFVLSHRNLKTLRLYHEVRATGGACLTDRERADRVLVRNLQTVDRIYREFEQHQHVTQTLNILQLVAGR